MESNGRASIREDLRSGGAEFRDLRDEAAGIAEDLRDLLQSEVGLAKAEVREQINLVVRSAIWGGIAAVAALLTLGFAGLTGMYALDLVLPLWLSALIVTAVLLTIAAIAGLMVKARIKQLSVVPKRTVHSIREDVAWAKRQLKSSTP
jgi:uncharacterized membrane protein YqjE